MKKIRLTQGQYAIVDDADYPAVSRYKWLAQKGSTTCYAVTWIKSGPFAKPVPLHRFLLNPPAKLLIDHIDHDGLNNRRSNLRIVTHQQNTWNSRPSRTSYSGFKGVTSASKKKGWKAHIKFNGRLFFLGYFPTSAQAALAYDKKAKKFFGQYAYLNFPLSGSSGVDVTRMARPGFGRSSLRPCIPETPKTQSAYKTEVGSIPTWNHTPLPAGRLP